MTSTSSTAGLSYTLDPSQPAGRRVSQLLVEGQPLDPERAYRVAVPDYLARGKDGYSVLAGARVFLGPEDGPGLLQSVLDVFARGRSP